MAVKRAPGAPAPGREQAPVAGRRVAYLEVIAAETPLASPIAVNQEETRLGRSPNLADIALTQDLTVSRLHATITWDGQVYRLYDEESTSGTWVNDQRVPEYGAQLIDGDEIFLGKVHLRFRHP
jgi:pSer/pThr/pTyr-binding forkhead associated (FHA) protein